MRSCIFKINLDVLLCIYTSLPAFRNPESGSSTTTPALYIENEWPNFKEELETINVGNEEIKRELKIGTLITPEEKEELIALLRDYVDVFAWSYEDMPGLDTNIVVHRIPLVEGCKPIK